MKRSVILFPKFDNLEVIESIREKYDPLANCIAPHITIVFPFDCDLSTKELKEHFAKSLKGIKKFNIQLKDITGDCRDGYLFLNVKRGNDPIIELHDKLYSGILEEFLCKGITYYPHLTVGRVQEQTAFNEAINELRGCKERFEAIIDKVFVENIDSHEKSSIEFVYYLE